MLDVVFGKIIIKSSINNETIRLLSELMKISVKNQIVPKFKSANTQLKIKNYNLICNNCFFVKNSDNCERCECKTINNHFSIFEIEKNILEIITRNIDSIKNSRILSLGYSFSSLVNMSHLNDNNELIITLTLNTDGVSIFKNNAVDAWPFYLVINELPVAKKFSIENIIILALYSGKSKINNRVMLNDTLRYLSEIEAKSFTIGDNVIKIKTIYGSFDKPASSLITYSTYFNSKYGCRFCLSERDTINRKPVFANIGKKRTHQFQIAKGIVAEKDQKSVYGLKGISSLRYFKIFENFLYYYFIHQNQGFSQEVSLGGHKT